MSVIMIFARLPRAAPKANTGDIEHARGKSRILHCNLNTQSCRSMYVHHVLNVTYRLYWWNPVGLLFLNIEKMGQFR